MGHRHGYHDCWFARVVTAAMLVKRFSPLGSKFYINANSATKNCIVLATNMAALSRGCKSRICDLTNALDTVSREEDMSKLMLA